MLRIKEILKEKGMTAKELAEKLGIAPTTFSLTIKGNPTIGTLQKVADALDVNLVELFNDQKSGEIICPHCGKRISINVK